jgi:hypothetical protein
MVRVVKFELPGGEVETLITDLFELWEECFPKLYFMHWPVETNTAGTFCGKAAHSEKD